MAGGERENSVMTGRGAAGRSVVRQRAEREAPEAPLMHPQFLSNAWRQPMPLYFLGGVSSTMNSVISNKRMVSRSIPLLSRSLSLCFSSFLVLPFLCLSLLFILHLSFFLQLNSLAIILSLLLFFINRKLSTNFMYIHTNCIFSSDNMRQFIFYIIHIIKNLENNSQVL